MRKYILLAIVVGVVSLLIGILPDLALSAKATRPAKSRPTRQKPEEILHRLLEQAPPVTPPSIPGRQAIPAARQPAVATARQKLLPEGYYISDRPGRLVRQQDKWAFAFDADSTDPGKPPIVLFAVFGLRFQKPFALGA